jgi:RNA polymerase-binding transcription factor DksA
MVKFLTTSGLSAAIEDLIARSNQRLYLISPYFALSPMLKRAIQRLDSTNANINIKVVYRREEKMNINPDDLEFLQKLKNVNILSLEFLHAKCYINETAAIVTSLNLLDVSQQRNWEMGFEINIEKDPELFEKIKKYVDDILNESKSFQYEIKKIEKETTSLKKVEIKEDKQKELTSGYCIRCGAAIELNKNKPFCFKCHSSLGKVFDFKHPEKYCHVCGKESPQSFARPICINCMNKLK